MSTLSVRALHADSGPVVVAEGELDLATAPQLVSVAEDVLSATSEGEVALDLSGVHFIDSTGVGALLQVRSSALSRARSTRVVAASAVVTRVLELTGLAEDLTGEPSL